MNAQRGRGSDSRGRGGGGGGGRGGGNSRGGGNFRGGGRGGGNSGQAGGDRKRENILDLKQYQDKQIRVKFQGGREVVGTLKGFDPLMNLVLDDTVEYLQDAMPSDPNQTRKLGLVVARGPLLVLISPVEGAEEIENPFLQGDDEAVEQEAS